MTLGSTIIANGHTQDARGWAIDPGAPYTEVEGQWFRAGTEPRVPKVPRQRRVAGVEGAGPVGADHAERGQGEGDTM